MSAEATNFFVRVGDEVEFSKTIAETDIYLFAGITGDLSPNHVNEQMMRRSKYGRRVAHGALLVGFMSTGSTRLIETFGGSALGKATAVSLGYDRIRFVAPVFIGDTITVRYRITRVEPARDRSYGAVVVTNENGTEVAVANHILKWVPNELVERAEQRGATGRLRENSALAAQQPWRRSIKPCLLHRFEFTLPSCFALQV
jgi:3-hydroxybutyryl-CoA dehydratase